MTHDNALWRLHDKAVRHDRNEADLRRFEAMVPGRHYLRPDECDTDELAAGRPIFNGCTHAWLTERYGDALGHELGVGWYIDWPEFILNNTRKDT